MITALTGSKDINTLMILEFAIVDIPAGNIVISSLSGYTSSHKRNIE
jgi:hypothetical protein